MSEPVRVTGMVLKTAPYAEYDRRMTLLTRDRGKITVFVRGAKRPGNRFLAATEPFVYGEFLVGEGKSAYNLYDVKIMHYFEELREDLPSFYLGSYFLEIADYYARENNDDEALLLLLARSLAVLTKGRFPLKLVKAVFEVKAVVVNGEFPGLSEKERASALPGTVHAFEHVVSSPAEKLYTFSLSEEVLGEFSRYAEEFLFRSAGKRFHSLELMRSLGIGDV